MSFPNYQYLLENVNLTVQLSLLVSRYAFYLSAQFGSFDHYLLGLHNLALTKPCFTLKLTIFFQTINFIEKEFVSKHSDNIRELAGHANDLHQLIADNKDPSLAIYLFDEHLKKSFAA